jgi:AcrR family transcriptional regulator
MPRHAPPGSRRTPLTRDAVLNGALRLADEIGVEAFTIRRLAAALDTKPMSIYHHVPSKDEILDGIVDLVFAEIELPAKDVDWRTAIRARYVSARAVLNRHAWAPPLMESRTSPGPQSLRHHDAVLGALRRGLSLPMTAHAYAILDAYLYGFTLQEASLPFSTGEEVEEVADSLAETMSAEAYPHLTEMIVHDVRTPGYSFGAHFEYGLDLILDALSVAQRAGAPAEPDGGTAPSSPE